MLQADLGRDDQIDRMLSVSRFSLEQFSSGQPFFRNSKFKSFDSVILNQYCTELVRLVTDGYKEFEHRHSKGCQFDTIKNVREKFKMHFA